MVKINNNSNSYNDYSYFIYEIFVQINIINVF